MRLESSENTAMNTIDDARLKALYRQHTTRNPVADADDIGAVLGRHGFPDEEDTALDRIAASAAASDALRLTMALAQDAQALSRDVAALRRPTVVALPRLRRGLAIAAGVGALAVLFATLHGGGQPGALGDALPASQSIMSGSFEPGPRSNEARVDIEEAAPIFRGDFDS